MPQLRKSEQKALFELLLGHIDHPQLQRALENAEQLPALDELASHSGNFRDTVQDVTTKLSRQYKVIPSIEAVLAELENACPPLQQFLDENRAEWQRRREQPTLAERVFDATHVPAGRWIAVALVATLAVAGAVLFRPDNTDNRGPTKTNLFEEAVRIPS